MKKNLTIVALLLVLLLVLVGTIGVYAHVRSSPQDSRNFWVLNNTGRVIRNFYVSPHESDSWGRDILGEAELPNGLGTTVTFDSQVRSSCVMDFRLVFRDGSAQTYRSGRNVCRLGAVQFNRETSTPLFYSD